jgi:hypothetical protein
MHRRGLGIVRCFYSLEDMNRQTVQRATVRFANRPLAKTKLIPVMLFETEISALVKLPDYVRNPELCMGTLNRSKKSLLGRGGGFPLFGNDPHVSLTPGNPFLIENGEQEQTYLAITRNEIPEPGNGHFFFIVKQRGEQFFPACINRFRVEIGAFNGVQYFLVNKVFQDAVQLFVIDPGFPRPALQILRLRRSHAALPEKGLERGGSVENLGGNGNPVSRESEGCAGFSQYALTHELSQKERKETDGPVTAVHAENAEQFLVGTSA